MERKLVPVLEKLSVEELMETNTYQRFNRSIEVVLENTEDLDVTAELGMAYITYLLTPWSRVLLEKLTGFGVNQEIPCIL